MEVFEELNIVLIYRIKVESIYLYTCKNTTTPRQKRVEELYRSHLMAANLREQVVV